MRGAFQRAVLWAACLATAAAWTGTTQAAAPPIPFTIRKDVAYGPQAQQRGDLLLPAVRDGRLRAAVLVIHGGGWIGGQRATNEWFSGLIANRGIVVFNVDYRLGVAADAGTRWPAQVADVQLAVRWLRANAKSLQIDPGRVAAAGDSAGATLAVFLGVLDRPVPGKEAQLLADEPSGVSAVLDQFGITDLAALGPGAAAMLDGLFGTPTPAASVVQTVSPLPFVTRHSAAMLIVHGDHDGVVPVAQSEQLVSTLQAHGIGARLDRYSGGHGYDGVAPAEQAILFNRSIDWLSQVLRP